MMPGFLFALADNQSRALCHGGSRTVWHLPAHKAAGTGLGLLHGKLVGLVPLSEEYWKFSLWPTNGLNVRGAPGCNKGEGTGCWLSWRMLFLLGCGLAAPAAPLPPGPSGAVVVPLPGREEPASGVSLPHLSSLASSDAVCHGLGAGFVCSNGGSVRPPSQQHGHLNRSGCPSPYCCLLPLPKSSQHLDLKISRLPPHLKSKKIRFIYSWWK